MEHSFPTLLCFGCNMLICQVLTRDFQPVKPDPAAVLHICKRWSLEPKLVAVVGDDKVDMICGRRAGTGGGLVRLHVQFIQYNVISNAIHMPDSKWPKPLCITHSAKR